MLDLVRRHSTISAVLAGVLVAFASAPWSLVPLLLLAFAIWVEAGRGEPDGKRAATIGLGVGMGFHVVGFHWVVPLFSGHVPIPMPIAVLLAIVFWIGHSLPFVASGVLAELLHSVRVPRSLALALAVPLAFDSVWTLFPFRPAELASPFHAFVQLADLSGPGPLDLLIVLAGAGTMEGLSTKRAWLALGGIGACILPFVYAVPRMAEIEATRERAPIARVGVVQPNIPQHLKMDERLNLSQLDAMRRLTAQVEREHVDFTVWPETAYPGVFPRSRMRDPVGRLAVHYAGVARGPVLFGAITGDGPCTNRNSAVSMDERGAVRGIGDKVLLLPFSETIPFYEQLTVLHRYVPCSGFVAGARPSVLPVGGSSVGLLNCYEDLFPWYARELALAHPDFLVNVTNDAWFFDTAEPHLHHMAARLRAIETRRDLVRVVNTGVTGHVDALGRRVDELPVWTEATRVFEVRRMPEASTVYMRNGDVFTPTLLGLVLVLLVARGLREALSPGRVARGA